MPLFSKRQQKRLLGLADAGMTMGSGMLGEVVSGFPVMADHVKGMLSDDHEPEGRVIAEDVQGALMREPQTEEGSEYLGNLGGMLEALPIEEIGEFYDEDVVPFFQENLGTTPGSALGAAGLGIASILGMGKTGAVKGSMDTPTMRQSQRGALGEDPPDVDVTPLTGTLSSPESISKADYVYNDTVSAAEPYSRSIVDVGRGFNETAQRQFDGPMDYTPENRAIVADSMYAEVKEALKGRPDAAGWYKANLEEAIDHASTKYPELKTDPHSRDAFTFIKAITSNGQKVDLNARLTDDYYRQFKETGRFPEIGTGKEKNAMKQSFETANLMMDKMGPDKFAAFLDKEFTVRELKEAGYKVGGENMDTLVRGSVIFGPKIGGGFMQNLRGNFDVPTFDRWWQRTWGRHTGTLMADPAKVTNQRKAFRQSLGQRKAMVEKLGFDLSDVKKNDDSLDALAKKMHTQFGKGSYKDKTAWNNASRNLDKSVSNVVDSPRGGGERSYMREVVRDIQGKLAADGTTLDMADVQALLWYFEKDLYKKSGARATAEGADYASAWKDIVGK